MTHHFLRRLSCRTILLLILIFPVPIMAQPDSSFERSARGRFLGLQQAVELALTKHPLLHEGAANLKASEARTEQARSLYYPQVYANANTVAGAGRSNPRFLIGGGLLQENQTAFAGGVIANQRLYDFGYTQNLVESNQLAQRAQVEDINARRAFIILNVQRTYLSSLKRRRLVQIAEETVRERGIIASQIEALHRQQLKSKLDFDLVRVELVNAESLLLKTQNDLKASFADLNRSIGFDGSEDYVLEDVSTEVRTPRALGDLIGDSLSHPELKRAKEQTASADARMRAIQAAVSSDRIGARQWWYLRPVRSSSEPADRRLVDGGGSRVHAALHGISHRKSGQ